MAKKELRKLNRKELLQMLVEFSEEAESIRAHEKEMQEQFDREREQLLQQMADERADLLAKFDDEKAEMRSKFTEQKEELQARFAKEKAAYIKQAAVERAELLNGFNEEKAEMRKKFNEQKAKAEELFQKDIKGLRARHDREFSGFRARLEREKKALEEETEKKLLQIEAAGTLAEAILSINGIFEVAQNAANQFEETLKKVEEVKKAEAKRIAEPEVKKEAEELSKIKQLFGVDKRRKKKTDSEEKEKYEIPDVLWTEEGEPEVQEDVVEEPKPVRKRTTRKKAAEVIDLDTVINS